MGQTILDILNELAAFTGKLDKLKILEREKDNELLKQVFHAALNRKINYYIKKIPEGYLEESANCKFDLSWALDQLSELSERKVTGHAGQDHLADVFSKLDHDDSEVLARIIQRDLKCGVQTQVDKVWPGLIPTLPIMLAKPMKANFIKKIKFPALAQLKSDGARCICVIQNGDVTLYSRNYKEYHNLNSLKEGILSFIPNQYGDCVLDGELLVRDGTGIADRQTGNGIINKSSKGTIKKSDADKMFIKVWDIIPYDAYFKDGVFKSKYKERLKVLKQGTINDKVEIIEEHYVADLQEAKKIYEMYRDQGEEGILLKNLDGYWVDKRSPDQVKFKAEFHCDLIVKEVIEGTKKYTGMLGAVRCETKDGLVEVNVGSGFNDEQREDYWNNPDKILDEVIEVKHNGLIQSKGKDKASVFLPIFQYIRNDKYPPDADTIDTIEERDALMI